MAPHVKTHTSKKVVRFSFALAMVGFIVRSGIGFSNAGLGILILPLLPIVAFIVLSVATLHFSKLQMVIIVLLLLIGFIYSVDFYTRSRTIGGLERIFQLYFLLALLIFIANERSVVAFTWVSIFLGCFLGVAVVAWIAVGRMTTGFRFLGFNPNGLGALALVAIGLASYQSVATPRLNRILRRVLIVVATLVVAATTSRAIMFALIMGIGVYRFTLWTRLGPTAIGLFVWGSVVVISIGLPVMAFTNIGQELNGILMRFTGQRLVSGRETIWAALGDMIRVRPWFGYGIDIRPGDLIAEGRFADTGLSAHSLWYQIALQSGVGVLALFVFLFFCLFRAAAQTRSIRVRALSYAVVTAVMVHQSFEVMLFQGNFAYSVSAWTVVLLLIFGNLDEHRDVKHYEITRWGFVPGFLRQNSTSPHR